MRYIAVRRAGWARVAIFVALAWMALPIPSGAQKNKDKKKDAQTSDAEASLKAAIPKSDSMAVDQAISEALGYWQIGDVESMHKYYADDVVVVSGAWEPPIIGWDNFVKAYQAQRAQVTGVRMDRSNTFIKINGNTAWATYQFVYAAMMETKMIQYRGHTTLALNKQGDRWVITVNHTSVVDASTPVSVTPPDSAQPGKP